MNRNMMNALPLPERQFSASESGVSDDEYELLPIVGLSDEDDEYELVPAIGLSDEEEYEEKVDLPAAVAGDPENYIEASDEISENSEDSDNDSDQESDHTIHLVLRLRAVSSELLDAEENVNLDVQEQELVSLENDANANNAENQDAQQPPEALPPIEENVGLDVADAGAGAPEVPLSSASSSSAAAIRSRAQGNSLQGIILTQAEEFARRRADELNRQIEAEINQAAASSSAAFDERFDEFKGYIVKCCGAHATLEQLEALLEQVRLPKWTGKFVKMAMDPIIYPPEIKKTYYPFFDPDKFDPWQKHLGVKKDEIRTLVSDAIEAKRKEDVEQLSASVSIQVHEFIDSPNLSSFEMISPNTGGDVTSSSASANVITILQDTMRHTDDEHKSPMNEFQSSSSWEMLSAATNSVNSQGFNGSYTLISPMESSVGAGFPSEVVVSSRPMIAPPILFSQPPQSHASATPRHSLVPIVSSVSEPLPVVLLSVVEEISSVSNVVPSITSPHSPVHIVNSVSEPLLVVLEEMPFVSNLVPLVVPTPPHSPVHSVSLPEPLPVPVVETLEQQVETIVAQHPTLSAQSCNMIRSLDSTLKQGLVNAVHDPAHPLTEKMLNLGVSVLEQHAPEIRVATLAALQGGNHQVVRDTCAVLQNADQVQKIAKQASTPVVVQQAYQLAMQTKNNISNSVPLSTETYQAAVNTMHQQYRAGWKKR